jgi:phosphotriesterase-related protein
LSHVQTVLGPVAPAELGVALPHEHLLLDFVGDRSSDAPTWLEPIGLGNYYHARRTFDQYRDNMQLQSVEVAVTEAGYFAAAGGGCIVDVTPIGLARDPAGLAQISRESGVHVVMGCAHYVQEYHPPDLPDEDAIVEEIVRDVEEGVDGVKAGIIGEVGLGWPVHPDERKVLRAAARAQARTGAALMVHPGRKAQAPLDAIRTVIDSGGNPERTVIAHLDRTLFELGDWLELARTGCYLELDLFGSESSFYPLAPIDMPNDATRLESILALREHSHLDQVLMAQDIDQKVRQRTYGGEGYGHILENVVPVMERKGFDRPEIDRLLVENPARMLSFA